MNEKICCGVLNSKFIKPDRDDWILGVKKVGNGYIIQTAMGADEDENGHIPIKEEVVAEDGTEFEEHEAAACLLYKVLEFFGPSYSKHNKKNVIIKVIEGDED